MPMSIARSPYAPITCWYAPASAAAVPQARSSFVPEAPPKDGTTSPPAARIVFTVAWSTPPVSGR